MVRGPEVGGDTKIIKKSTVKDIDTKTQSPNVRQMTKKVPVEFLEKGAELLPRSSRRSTVKDIDTKTKVSQCLTDDEEGNRGREWRSERHSAGIC